MTRVRFLATFFCTILFTLIGHAAYAASLSFSPSSGSYHVGQTFSVGVYVSSADQAANAVSGVVNFPASQLEVTSVSKSDSVLNLWVREPSFSNAAGTVQFEGIILNPGFKGPSARVMTVNFRVRDVPDATVTFSGASILANDGQGTSILTGTGRAHFTFTTAAPTPTPAPTPAPAPTPTPAPSPTAVPAPPTVSSPTFPDSAQTYQAQAGIFQWSLPKDAVGVSFVSDRNPGTVPDSISEGLLNSTTQTPNADGTWYFHVRIQNANGWGDAAHYKYQVTTQPVAPVKVVPRILEDVDSLPSPSWLVVHGTAGANDVVTLYLQRENGPIFSQDVTADSHGNWLFVSGQKLNSGTYHVWVKNGSAAPLTIHVRHPLLWVVYLMLLNPASAWPMLLFLLFLMCCVFIYHRFIEIRFERRVENELGRLQDLVGGRGRKGAKSASSRSKKE